MVFEPPLPLDVYEPPPVLLLKCVLLGDAVDGDEGDATGTPGAANAVVEVPPNVSAATANAATPALTTDPTNKFDFFMINPSYIIFMSLIYRFENLRLSTLYSNYC